MLLLIAQFCLPEFIGTFTRHYAYRPTSWWNDEAERIANFVVMKRSDCNRTGMQRSEGAQASFGHGQGVAVTSERKE
jgi:hypothetical protein